MSSSTCCILLWNCLLCISLYLGSVIVSYWFFHINVLSDFLFLLVCMSTTFHHDFARSSFDLNFFYTLVCGQTHLFKGGGSVGNHGSHTLFTQFLYRSVLMRQHVAWRLGIWELYFSGCNLAVAIVCTRCQSGERCFTWESSLIYMFKSK